MAAKIIKGGDSAQPLRPAASSMVLPRDVAVGGKKVLDKETLAARSNAGQALSAAQAEAQARAERAREEAAAAEQEAFERASRAARQEALETILRAYCRRGESLAGAAQECLDVAGALVGKITGRPLTLPPSVSVELIQAALRTKRAKFPAVLVLPPSGVEKLKSYGTLMKAFQARPELKLELGDSGVLKVAGGEVPLDVEMASLALSAVLGVELVEGPAEEPEPPPARARPEPVEGTSDDVPVRRWTDNARSRAPAPVEQPDDGLADEPPPAMADSPPPARAPAFSGEGRPTTGRYRLDTPAPRPPSRVVPLGEVPRPASGLRPLHPEQAPEEDGLAVTRPEDRPRRSVIPAPVLSTAEGTRMESNPLNNPRPPRPEPEGNPANGTRVDVRSPRPPTDPGRKLTR